MPIRVAFISLFSYGYFNYEVDITGGGTERQLYIISQELNSDFDVNFVVGDYGQSAVETRDGVTLHRAYEPDPRAGPVVQLSQIVKLFRAMRSTNADVFVLRSRPRKAVVTYLIAQALGAEWIYNVANDSHVDEDPDQLSSAERSIFVHALRNAAGVVAQTPYQQRRLRERFGVTSTVIPNGYTRAETVNGRDERSYFLWVGRIDESQKQPDRFLDLAARLPDFEFVLVGPARDDAYFEQIEQRIAKLGNVTYEGPVDPDEIHDYYSDAIAVVNTSAHEGFPNTFLEAWRMRTPVVSLNVDPGRFVENSLCECYADGDFESLVNLSERLANNRDIWEDCATVPHRYFEENLTIEQIATSYAELLRSATR